MCLIETLKPLIKTLKPFYCNKYASCYAFLPSTHRNSYLMTPIKKLPPTKIKSTTMAFVKTVTLLWLVSSSHSLLPRVAITGTLPSQALAGAWTPVELEDF